MHKINTYLVSNHQTSIHQEFVRIAGIHKIPYKDHNTLLPLLKNEVIEKVKGVNFANSLVICLVTDKVERLNVFTDLNRALTYAVKLSINETDFEVVKDEEE